MRETTPSVCKTISWLLGILLLGAVALLVWYSKNEQGVLAGKNAEIAQMARQVTDRDHQIEQSEEAAQALRADKQRLTEELATTDQAHQRLRTDLEALKAQHAKTLAMEQEKARLAYADIQERNQAANERITTLETEKEKLQQAIAEAEATQEARLAAVEAAHEAQRQQLEQQMKERVDFYRTALEGSAPERAAQLGGLTQKLQENQQTLDQVQQAMRTLQKKESDLQEQLAAAERTIDEHNQALAEREGKIKSLEAGLAREQSAYKELQQKYDGALAKATEAHTKLQQELRDAFAAHKKAEDAAATAMQAAQEAHAAKVKGAEKQISDLTARLQAETTALGILRKEHEATVTELRGSLDAAKQTLVNVEHELSAAKEATDQARQTHEQQLAEAQTRISGLEQMLEQTRGKAAADLAASRREGEAAETDIRETYTDFAKLGGQPTDQGMLLSLAEEDLRFRISKADLPDSQLQSLDRIAELLVKHPKLMARIEGHTDGNGRDETNLELSQKRADAVKQALAERGVDPQRMTAVGIGEARPIADNSTAAGRRKNRRVEIYVIEK